MKRLLIVIVLLAVIGVAVGYYLEWFHISTGGTDGSGRPSITVDQEKIKADEDRAKAAARDFEQKVKEKASAATGTGKGETQRQ
jgi:hypothetical protein